MVDGDTEMEGPVPAEVPPHEPVNHSTMAPLPSVPPVAVSVVLPPLQMLVEPLTPVGATEEVKGVAVTLSWRSPVAVLLK